MTPAAYIAIALNVLGWTFAAGGAWFLVRQMRRDLNGLGAKANRIQAEADRRFMTVAILLLAACDDKDREILTDRILHALGK